jgi:hypothetical protein
MVPLAIAEAAMPVAAMLAELADTSAAEPVGLRAVAQLADSLAAELADSLAVAMSPVVAASTAVAAVASTVVVAADPTAAGIAKPIDVTDGYPSG